jgi:peptidoglycan/LPS O-acetylase OafA/YrhL
VVVFRLHSEWGWGRGLRTTLAAVSLVALVALLGFVDMPELGLQTSLLAPLMGGLILGIAGTDWLSNSWLVSLGSASYSLYILQNPVHVYLKLGASLLFFHERTSDSLNGSAIFAVVYIVLSVMISLLAFRWLEDPARKWIGRAWRTTPAAGLIQAK